MRRREYVPYEKSVTEHRAPTDDSIRIINEMEQKIKQNLLGKLVIKQNFLNAEALFFITDFPTDTVECFIKFTLNEQEFKLKLILEEHEIDKIKWDDPYGAPNKVVEFVIVKISEAISAELIQKSIPALNKLIQNKI